MPFWALGNLGPRAIARTQGQIRPTGVLLRLKNSRSATSRGVSARISVNIGVSGLFGLAAPAKGGVCACAVFFVLLLIE